jgi:autotransporter family porin
MRRGPGFTIFGAISIAAAILLPASAAAAKATTQPVGFVPLSDQAAAALVQRTGFEPRPQNVKADHTIPGRRMVRQWRKRNKMPYRRFVDGNFMGTTDEIIQWAAYKWGLDEDVLRAVAVVESWWRQSTVGGQHSSYGLFQVRAPFHCSGKCAIARRSTAFNADYYGGILRAYYDGKMTWLNKEPHGRKYSGGDLWGSVGAWFSGRWWTAPAANYIAAVQQRLAERTWAQPGF